jgi:hypothetical protein
MLLISASDYAKSFSRVDKELESISRRDGDMIFGHNAVEFATSVGELLE